MVCHGWHRATLPAARASSHPQAPAPSAHTCMGTRPVSLRAREPAKGGTSPAKHLSNVPLNTLGTSPCLAWSTRKEPSTCAR